MCVCVCVREREKTGEIEHEDKKGTVRRQREKRGERGEIVSMNVCEREKERVCKRKKRKIEKVF